MTFDEEDWQKKIEETVATIGSLSRVREYGEQYHPELVQKIARRYQEVREGEYRHSVWKIIRKLGKVLDDRERLQMLARDDPQAFDKEINRIFSDLKSDVKALFNRPSRGRPAQQLRDREIARMHEDERKTFGEIAIAMKIKPKAAEQAYRRFHRVDQNDLRELVEDLLFPPPPDAD